MHVEKGRQEREWEAVGYDGGERAEEREWEELEEGVCAGLR